MQDIKDIQQKLLRERSKESCGLMQDIKDIQLEPTAECLLLRCGLMQDIKDIQLRAQQERTNNSCGLMQDIKDIQHSLNNKLTRCSCGLMQNRTPNRSLEKYMKLFLMTDLSQMDKGYISSEECSPYNELQESVLQGNGSLSELSNMPEACLVTPISCPSLSKRKLYMRKRMARAMRHRTWCGA